MISSAEGTLAIPPESEKMTVCVINKGRGRLRKPYMGEEETPKCTWKHCTFLVPRSALCRNTEQTSSGLEGTLKKL